MEAHSKEIEDIEFLARSHARMGILAELNEHGPLSKHELRSRVDVSRTTLIRALKSLERRGWITNTTNEYAIAHCGRLIFREFTSLIESVEHATELQPVLEHLDIEALDLDPRLLADAEVTVSSPSNPYAPVVQHVEALRTAEEVRCLLGVVGYEAMDVAAERVQAGTVSYELVVDSVCADALRSDPHYAEAFETCISTDAFDVWVYDGDVPCYIGVLDEIVQLGVEDQGGIPRALLETRSQEARTWADDIYAEYKQQAEPHI